MKLRELTLCCGTLLWSILALGQERPVASGLVTHGTIAAIAYRSEVAVIAADSRSSNFAPGVEFYRDDYCKIVPLGKNVVFVMAGLARFSGNESVPGLTPWQAVDEARQQYLRLVKKHGEWRDDMLNDLASDWALVIGHNIYKLKTLNPDAMAKAGGLIVSAIFVSAVGPSVQTYRVDFPARENATHMRELRPFTWDVIGETTLWSEMKVGSTLRGRKAADEWNKGNHSMLGADVMARAVIRLIELTITHMPENKGIGGPIDVLELPASGPLRWIQRKPNCPE